MNALGIRGVVSYPVALWLAFSAEWRPAQAANCVALQETAALSGLGVLALCGAGLLFSWFAVPVICRWFPWTRRQRHHTHGQPISRCGGVAIVVPFLLTAVFARAALPGGDWAHQHLVVVLGALAMFGLGFMDDAHPLGAKRKLLVQVGVASAVYVAGLQISHVRDPFRGVDMNLGLWSYAATVFWLVALTNLINLIDGADGLAAGIALMVLLLLGHAGFNGGLVLPTVCAATVGGALLGFLRYNFPPARIYLGDGGAYFLGFLIGILAMVNSQKGTVAAALIAPLFPLALPIVDMALAILRRGLKGLPIFRPDRRHLHHRLADLGLSRLRVLLMFYGATLFFLGLGFLVELSQGRWLPLTTGLGAAALFVSAGSFHFSREWFAIRKVLGDALATRRQTRYALALGRWLELEAQRAASHQCLWRDFEFLAHKIGFDRIALIPRGGSGPDDGRCSGAGLIQWCRQPLPGGDALEFQASGDLAPETFQLLAELTAEIWLKAMERRHRCDRSSPGRCTNGAF